MTMTTHSTVTPIAPIPAAEVRASAADVFLLRKDDSFVALRVSSFFILAKDSFSLFSFSVFVSISGGSGHAQQQDPLEDKSGTYVFNTKAVRVQIPEYM